jgi:hypothetical protein
MYFAAEQVLVVFFEKKEKEYHYYNFNFPLILLTCALIFSLL